VHLDLSGQPELEARHTLSVAGAKGLTEAIAESWRPAMASVRLSSLRTTNESDPGRNLAVDVELEANSIGRRVDAELLVNAAMMAASTGIPSVTVRTGDTSRSSFAGPT
jgi:hypothetical protein